MVKKESSNGAMFALNAKVISVDDFNICHKNLLTLLKTDSDSL